MPLGVAVLASLMPLGGSGADASGPEAYQIDRWMSHEVGGVRIRPQLDINMMYNNNVFSASDLGAIEYVDPRNPTYRVSDSGGGYVFRPAANQPLQPYTGILQNQVYDDAFLNQRIAASPAFPASVHPPLTVALPPQAPATATYLLAGFQTNRYALNPKVSDLIGTVSPGVSFQMGSEEENHLNLQYQSDNTRYFDLGVSPVPMHRILLAGKYDNRSRLRMEGTHATEFVSSFMGGWVNLGQTLVDRWSHNTSGRVTYDSTDKTDVYLSGNHNYLNFQNVNLYGNDGWRANLGASYKPTDRVSVFVEGGYGLTDFIRGTSALGFIPTSHVYGGFVGLRGQFTERLDGTIGGGYEIREFPDIPGASFSIPAANVAVNYAFRETTKFSLSYTRRTDNAAQIARQGVTYDTAAINVQQLLGTTGTWMATGGVSYQGGAFDSLTGFGTAFEPIAGTRVRSLNLRTVDYKRDDTMVSLSGGISYIPRKWLRFGLNYSYENYSIRYADAGLRDVFLPAYDAHRVMAGVQIGY
ncbi:MAG: putative beta-barrel porin 2 [Verrucomicrobiota bacterium]|jgi:hypothetical protein